MEVTVRAIWGLAFALSPIVILIIVISIPKSWQKWVAPLIFIMPLSLQIMSVGKYPPVHIFQGVVVAAFLYGFCILLIVLFDALRKLQKARILRK